MLKRKKKENNNRIYFWSELTNENDDYGFV